MTVLQSGRELLFAPSDPVRARILNLVDDAKRSIDLHAYILTLDPLVDSMCSLAKNGRTIRVIVSSDPERKSKTVFGNRQREQIKKLRDSGAVVKLGLSSHGGILHGKYGIVDNAAVFHGSYNFTSAAENQSNHVCIEHEADAIRIFMTQFQQEWDRLV